MQRMVIFGAGAIGRSFIGQLFARGGWHVTFVDINAVAIAALNQRRCYRVVIKRSGEPDEVLTIENVAGLLATDAPAVAAAAAGADLLATSVGQKALPAILKHIALGLELRREAGRGPLDVILAENIHHGAAFCRAELAKLLPTGFPLEERLGLVETSIGKMVPIMRQEDLEIDPLWVFAEPYNELIVDEHGFLNPVPRVPGLKPVPHIAAYVDRKLYLHNLGHAAAAYFGYLAQPGTELLADVLADEPVLRATEAAMRESVAVLHRAYPGDFTIEELEHHMHDLLRRFRNRALGDTVYRVGRDLFRKLSREDRLVGAMLLAATHGLTFSAIARAWHAGVQFRATDEQGQSLPDDLRFQQGFAAGGVDWVLREVSHLDSTRDLDRQVMARLKSEA